MADRFIRQDGRWFDLATTCEVTVRLYPAGPRREQLAWAEQCAMLAPLRHPLLPALVDYGAAGAHTLFEAFAPRAAATGRCPPAKRFVRHAARFLEAHGVPLTPGLARMVQRCARPAAASAAAGRPVGVVLQPRPAEARLAELLECPAQGGLTAIRVGGAPGSGLRTLLGAIARVARMAGYVPVCSAALVRWPEVADAVTGRHVCVLAAAEATAAERLAIGRLLVRLAGRSARPHICLTAERAERRSGAAVYLDPMGRAQMSSMVYLDPELGPSADEVVVASGTAHGRPARLLSALGALPCETPYAGRLSVHESPATYSADPLGIPVAASRPSGRSRLDAAVRRSHSRASELRRRGRHAAAGRLLARAARVLQGRGEPHEAARCWLQFGWMARNRGVTTRAVELAGQAQITDPSLGTQLAAACLIAVCRTDEGRLVEAEASLRSLGYAAAALESATHGQRCLLALARVMYWSGRQEESVATLEPLLRDADAGISCEALALAARARLRAGELPAAIRLAREAGRRAGDYDDMRVRAAVHRTMGAALLEAGDTAGARAPIAAGLQAAAAARLPLVALRLRALLLQALVEGGAAEEEQRRVRTVLERARRRPLPALLRRLLDAACVRGGAAAGFAAPSRDPGSTHLAHFLEVAQRAPDDTAAVGDVLAALCEAVGATSAAVLAPGGRVLVAAGRPWREPPRAAAKALAAGHPIAPDQVTGGEAGEPVRCGGELLAALGCRWLAGTAAPGRAADALRAASMAMATHVRGVLEAVVVDSSPGVWSDLLGESAGAGALREAIQRAARAPFPVLIEGESGSGKELVARAIHKLSARHTRRFCAINCAALSDELVEAELFGHTRGAFTGATAERAGLFEDADGGTLFLDEVGELSARAQAKLLRVLQEGEVRRIGENLPRRVDVRVVAATNRRLEQEAAGGRFRTDLRFRLDVLRIIVPPLRERATDIPLLAQHFWRQACARVGSQAVLAPDALAALSRHDWPGNVRELQNAIAWLSVHAPRRGRVSARLLPAQLAASPMATGSFEAAREEFERRFVRAALVQAGGQRQAAARALGMSRQGLAKMLRRLGIPPEGAA